MEHIIDGSTRTTPRKKPVADANVSGTAHQAYQILHVGFVVAPIVAGLDKVFNLLVNWEQSKDLYVADRETTCPNR